MRCDAPDTHWRTPIAISTRRFRRPFAESTECVDGALYISIVVDLVMMGHHHGYPAISAL